jgi:small subunit ribosomal protein SAe
MAIGLVMWLLTREVLRLRGELLRAQEWKVLPDLFFYRSAIDEERIKEEMDQEGQETGPQETPVADAAPVTTLAPQAAHATHASEQEWSNAENQWGV